MPMIPDAGQDATSWPVRQVAFPAANGTRFILWEEDPWPSSWQWQLGEPYWEDSLGCSRLVRNLDGSVYRPGTPSDLSTAEPVVAQISSGRRTPATAPPVAEGVRWASLISPRWQVGDTWVTQDRCSRPVRTYARNGAWVFGAPPPLEAAFSTFSFYQVPRRVE